MGGTDLLYVHVGGTYGRLAMERLIFDELEAAIDPNASKSFRLIEQGARRDYRQRFWWRPGTTLPRRGPELGTAVGGSVSV